MTTTPKLDALLNIVSANPPSWRMLKRTPPLLNLCNCVPDERGGEVLTLTATTLRELCTDIGRAVGGVIDDDGNGFGWLRRDGANLFDPPDIKAAAFLAKHMFYCARKAIFGMDRLFQHLGNAYMLAMWVARQNGIIDADTWGACFMAGWISQPGSLHLAIDLSELETAAMFAAMGDTGGFYWNRNMKTRADLPATIQLHRGIASQELRSDYVGYSWTESHEAAAFYAIRRYGQNLGTPQVLSATFKREDIASVFEHRKKGDETGKEGYGEWLIYPSAQPENVSVARIDTGLLTLYPELATAVL